GPFLPITIDDCLRDTNPPVGRLRYDVVFVRRSLVYAMGMLSPASDPSNETIIPANASPPTMGNINHNCDPLITPGPGETFAMMTNSQPSKRSAKPVVPSLLPSPGQTGKPSLLPSPGQTGKPSLPANDVHAAATPLAPRGTTNATSPRGIQQVPGGIMPDVGTQGDSHSVKSGRSSNSLPAPSNIAVSSKRGDPRHYLLPGLVVLIAVIFGMATWLLVVKSRTPPSSPS
ncbi:MAG: hypothetical protein JWM17_916, partial [Actinobacteria bacterium]|nr:hypothetical protein [Actinomycetota bacterium]